MRPVPPDPVYPSVIIALLHRDPDTASVTLQLHRSEYNCISYITIVPLTSQLYRSDYNYIGHITTVPVTLKSCRSHYNCFGQITTVSVTLQP